MNFNLQLINEIEEKIAYRFQDQATIERIFTHTSYAHEFSLKKLKNNELWEFLGDAVVDLCFSCEIIKKYPDLSEGQSSKLRGTLVNDQMLATYARHLKLEELLLLGKGEELIGGRNNFHNLAATFEALWGGIVAEAGVEVALRSITHYFQQYHDDLIDIERLKYFDAKSRLQEFCIKHFRCFPRYEVMHQKQEFSVQLKIFQRSLSHHIHSSKKNAMKMCAQEVMQTIDQYLIQNISIDEIQEKLC